MIPFNNNEFGWGADSVGRWMTMHGLTRPTLVKSFAIDVNYADRQQTVTFERYAAGENGQPYCDGNGEIVMDEPFTVPLLCLPPIWSQAEIERMDRQR